jgi:Thiamine pyrophosphate enzyme, central domain
VTDVSAAELWRRTALVSGIDATYGAPFGTLGVVPMPDAVARLCAAAHERVHGTRAAVHRGDGLFWVPGRDDEPGRTMELDSAGDLLAAVPSLRSSGELEIRLTVDPDRPVDGVVPPPVAPDDNWVEPADDVVEATASASRVLVLAGPGVVRCAAVPGLHDLAVAAGVGVLNTWGAKGVFDWRSRHHVATIGLQADDFVLSGLEDTDLILATGLDRVESPDDRWRLAPALMVPPAGLAPLAERCGRDRRAPMTTPPLRARLAEVTQRGWVDGGSPLPPSRVTLHYGEQVAGGALVAADAGVSGFWVARTLGTTRLGAVLVPATSSPGFAAACVAVARLRHPGRPALAVVDLAQAEATALVAETAARLGIRIPVEAWGAEGDPLDAEAHRDRLRRLLFDGLPATATVCTLGTHPGQLSEMIDAAGPIVAWT